MKYIFKWNGTCIDLILTNKKYYNKHSSAFETSLSYHYHLIYFMLKTTYKKEEPKFYKNRRCKKLDNTAFHMVLQNILDEGLKIINRRWSQMRDNKKTKHAKISKKWTYLTPLRPRTWAFQSIRNVCFFGKFGVLCFVVTSVLRFAFLPYYRPKLYIEKNSGKVSIKRSAQKRKASGTK